MVTFAVTYDEAWSKLSARVQLVSVVVMSEVCNSYHWESSQPNLRFRNLQPSHLIITSIWCKTRTAHKTWPAGRSEDPHWAFY